LSNRAVDPSKEHDPPACGRVQDVISKRLRVPLGLSGLTVWGLAAVGTAGPMTDIVRVDDYIGAPRALFGRTGADAERILGPPIDAQPGAVASYLDPAVLHPTRRLTYPGLVIDVLATGRIRRVRIGAPGWGLPFGLDVGSRGDEVERVLGEPQEATDRYLMYLYSDGYPETVHFYLRDGGVRGIEWNFGSAE
jgi:hypothetical protein